MREPIACGLLIACAALFPAQFAASEEPFRRIVPARGSPNQVGRATRAHGKSPIPRKQRAIVPSMNAPTRWPANVRPEWPLNSQPVWKGGKPAPVDPPMPVGNGVESFGEIVPAVTAEPDKSEAAPAEADQSAFLLPILMPSDYWKNPEIPFLGLTTNPFPPWSIINPDQTFMSATN